MFDIVKISKMCVVVTKNRMQIELWRSSWVPVVLSGGNGEN